MAQGATTYTTFAKAFTSYQEQYGSNDAGPSRSSQIDSPIRHDIVLDEEGGLVNSLMSAIEQTVRANKPDVEDQVIGEEREALLREHRTWHLLRALYDNRLSRSTSEFAPIRAKDRLAANPYTSPEDLTQIIVNEDDELSLLAVLIEHLQSRPVFTSSLPIEARHGYLPTTLRRSKQPSVDSLSLDPDFTLRNPHGQGLAGEDQSYQTPLLAALWDLLRHGEMDRAVKVCEEGGEPWRAASLLGGRRWGMGGLTSDSIPNRMVGNRTRALWKRSCRAIAQNPLLSASERRLYAALISDLPTLLPACESWEDHLWAHITARMESRLESKLKSMGGFWAEMDRSLGRDEQVTNDDVGDMACIFRTISSVQDERVILANHDPYFAAQRAILLDQTDSLFNHFAASIPELEDAMSPELIGPLVRFFAHLILVLRTLSQPVPDGAANSILQAYLQILDREGSTTLVAMYAACLREGSGEESYARFLQAMDATCTREQRAEALLRARLHNLDVAIIARETVRLTLVAEFATIPALSGGQPDVLSFAIGVSERDVHLIRAIEWLTMTPETAVDALIQSNAVGRYFLALGNAGAAQSLLQTLPQGIADVIDQDDTGYHATEHDDFVKLFGVFASYELVEAVLARSPKTTASKVEQLNWRKSLASAIQKTQRNTIDILTSDWMRFPIASRNDISVSQRRKELHRIRQIFIPDITLRLHDLLIAHRHILPTLLQQALDLTKIVADEDNHCYEEFFGRGGSEDDPFRLLAYLEKVREAGMAVLEAGASSPIPAAEPAPAQTIKPTDALPAPPTLPPREIARLPDRPRDPPTCEEVTPLPQAPASATTKTSSEVLVERLQEIRGMNLPSGRPWHQTGRPPPRMSSAHMRGLIPAHLIPRDEE